MYNNKVLHTAARQPRAVAKVKAASNTNAVVYAFLASGIFAMIISLALRVLV